MLAMASTPRSLVPTIRSHMKPNKCFTERTIVCTHLSIFPSRTALLLIVHPLRIDYCADLYYFRFLFIHTIADFSIDTGTFYACRDIHVHSDYSKLPPLSSALPFIRRAHIRFRLYHWLYDQFMSFPRTPDTIIFRANINHISKLLAKARCLQSLKIIWTETAKHPLLGLDIGPEAGMTNFWRSHIDKIVQPLATIQRSCTVRKSDVVVRYMQSTGPFGRPSGHAVDMEDAFSSSIDGLIAMRASSAR